MYNGRSGALLKSFFAFNPSFGGGATVAAGDVNGDGADDIITGAGPSDGPNVVVFNGKTGAVLASFSAFDPAFSAGVTVVAEDLNHDGRADIIAGAGPAGGANVVAFDGATLKVLDSFFAYQASTGHRRTGRRRRGHQHRAGRDPHRPRHEHRAGVGSGL